MASTFHQEPPERSPNSTSVRQTPLCWTEAPICRDETGYLLSIVIRRRPFESSTALTRPTSVTRPVNISSLPNVAFPEVDADLLHPRPHKGGRVNDFLQAQPAQARQTFVSKE